MMSYAKRHPDLRFSVFAIPQIPGTAPRSKPVRGVLESFVKTKKYAFPLGALVAVQPYLGGGLAYAWISGGHFNPRHIASTEEAAEPPDILAEELEWNQSVSPAAPLERHALEVTLRLSDGNLELRGCEVLFVPKPWRAGRPHTLRLKSSLALCWVYRDRICGRVR